MTEARARLDLLTVTYPRLFPAGPLAWGFELGDGWTELIVTLCERLNTILEADPDARFGVRQVKEKFGALRFYYELKQARDDTVRLIRQAVDLAETASASVCESCGRPSQMRRDDGWYTTRCELCYPNPA